MTNGIWILIVCLLLLFGFRMMARLDHFLSSAGKSTPDNYADPHRNSSLRRFFALYFSGESLRRIAQKLPLWGDDKEDGMDGSIVFHSR